MFNTGFEYKFVFGLQPSEDIEYFGGDIEDDPVDNDGYVNNATITWTADDKATCLSALRMIEAEYELPAFDTTKYLNSIEGTYILNTDVYDIPFDDDKYNKKVYYKYILGLFIYHQLNYRCPLVASYELI